MAGQAALLGKSPAGRSAAAVRACVSHVPASRCFSGLSRGASSANEGSTSKSNSATITTTRILRNSCKSSCGTSTSNTHKVPALRRAFRTHRSHLPVHPILRQSNRPKEPLPPTHPSSSPSRRDPFSTSSFSTSTSTSQYYPKSSKSGRSSIPYFDFRLIPPRPRCTSCCFAMTQARDHGGNGSGHDHDHDHSHEGHSHSHGLGHHHHHHDNTYLISANKNDPGVRITRIGLVSNLAMAIVKFIGGYAFNSKAMIADAWHSIADLGSDILTLATVSFSLKPPSDQFPMGFGKVESMGSLGVSGMLLFGGLYMGWESAVSLYGHINPDGAHEVLQHMGGHSHSHGGHGGHGHSHGFANLGIPSVHAAWLAGGTILVKEWLYRATMKVARERKSSVLASNAVHHRVDSLTGIVTLFAILGANILSNAAWLDPVGGLLISIMVIQAGFSNTLEALRELADQSIDTEVKANVKKHGLRALNDVGRGHEVELREVTGVKSGQNYLVDVELGVPGLWTVEETKEVEDAVRTMIGGKVRGVRRLRIRFVNKDAEVNEKFDEFIPGDVEVPPEEEAHGHEQHKHKH